MVDCTVHTKSSAMRGSAVQKQPCSLALPFVSFVPPLATQPTPLPIFSLSHLGSPLSSSPHQDIRVTASCLPGFKRPLSALSQFWSWFCSVYTNRNLCFQTLKSYAIWLCLILTFDHGPIWATFSSKAVNWIRGLWQGGWRGSDGVDHSQGTLHSY